MIFPFQPARIDTRIAAALVLAVIALPMFLSGCDSSSSSSSPRVATLYAGGNSSQGIDVFDLAANGSLTLRENFNSDQSLFNPRSMAINAEGERLVAGLSASTGLQIFPVHADTGELTDIDVYLDIRNIQVAAHPELDVFYASRSGGLGTLHAVAVEDIGTMSEALLQIDEYDTTHNIASSVIHPSGGYVFISHADNAPDPSEHWVTMLPLDAAGEFNPPAAEEILVQDDVWNPRIKAISPDGDMLIITSSNSYNRVGFVTINTTTESLTMDTGPLNAHYRGAVFHPDGNWAYAATVSGVVTAYAIDRTAGEITQIGENLDGPPLDNGVGVLAISPDGTTLFSALEGDDLAGNPGQIAIIDIDQSDGSLSLRTTVDMNIVDPLSLLATVTGPDNQ